MCFALEPKSGLKVQVDDEHRDLNKDNKGTGVQLASSVDRRTGSQLVVDDAGHNFPGLIGTGAQSISTNEARDLGNTRGTGAQIAGGSKKQR